MALTPDIIESVRRYEALIRRLQDYGLPHGKGFIAAFMAKKDEMAAQWQKEQRVWEEINRTLLPVFLATYVLGSDIERQEIRDLLKDNAIIAWGLGWDHSTDAARRRGPVEENVLRRSLILSAMKDGSADFRDEIVGFDEFCAIADRSGLDAGQLLGEAAQLASDAPRAGKPSYRATLIAWADKLAKAR